MLPLAIIQTTLHVPTTRLNTPLPNPLPQGEREKINSVQRCVHRLARREKGFASLSLRDNQRLARLRA
jgi:hypothetical protein